MKLGLTGDQKKIEDAFLRLAEAYPADYLPNMEASLSASMERLTSFADNYVGPNLKVAQDLEARCRLLLGKYKELTDEKRALAVGAIRYFIVNMDGLPDSTPICGFDDDVVVMNAVLEQLGLSAHRIEV